MEEWLLMQGFYHGLTQKSREQLDATAGGSFMSLTLGKAEVLMKRIASNQGWSSCNIQLCNKSEEVPEKMCALSTKMDVEFARTARQLQERSSGHSRCIQCSKTDAENI
jgi:hypothetical protein